MTSISEIRCVNIEPTTACNLNCTICSKDKSKRKTEMMEWGLFEEIIRQLSELNLHAAELRFFLSGEPTLAPLLPNMVEYARDHGFYNSLVHTNGTQQEPMHALLRAGLEHLSISIDGATKKEYESVRVGSCFDTVVVNAKSIVERSKQLGTRVTIQAIVPVGINIADYTLKMRSLIPGADRYYVRHPHCWNKVNSVRFARPVNDGRRTRCFPDRYLSIYLDGRVPLCCNDLNGDLIIGHVVTDGIKDIWEDKMEKYRLRMLAQEDIPELCDNCERYRKLSSLKKLILSTRKALHRFDRLRRLS